MRAAGRRRWRIEFIGLNKLIEFIELIGLKRLYPFNLINQSANQHNQLHFFPINSINLINESTKLAL